MDYVIVGHTYELEFLDDGPGPDEDTIAEAAHAMAARVVRLREGAERIAEHLRSGGTDEPDVAIWGAL